jgi:UDP-N-acetylmuramoyl-tripeptide--D-alanyl-D-alanine ligase
MIKPTSLEELYHVFSQCGQRVCTDTRKIEEGSIFFALKGPNFNANRLAADALAGGCSYAVIDDADFHTDNKTLLVGDVLTTMQDLARHHRRQFKIPVLAITGSNGKTTNKELINAVVSQKYNTLATEGNLNNHIGVPLTLLKLTTEHEFAIIEMGANHLLEIETLCKIAEPGFGLITNIGKAHLEGFGGIEGVKKGKSELYHYLRVVDGKAFINGDDPTLTELAANNDKITFGCKKLYDVIGKDCTTGKTVCLKYTTRYHEKNWERIEKIDTQIIGGYNFINCLAAVAVGVFFEVTASAIKNALETYVPAMNRSQLVNTQRNTVILDAYNANPNSMKVAIENFASYKADHKLVLLGDMFELGDYSRQEHEKVVELLRQLKVNNAILVGLEFMSIANGGFMCFKTTAECFEYLKNNKVEHNTILIKGSRSMKMESLLDAL